MSDQKRMVERTEEVIDRDRKKREEYREKMRAHINVALECRQFIREAMRRVDANDLKLWGEELIRKIDNA